MPHAGAEFDLTSLKAVLFDMDGVLVDVSQSYRRVVEETVRLFTGQDVPTGMVQQYKNAGGFNDDWLLTHTIIGDFGFEVAFSDVVDAFQRMYLGVAWDGLIADEPPLIRRETLSSLAERIPNIGLVTGRPDSEARWTLERFGWTPFFPIVVTMEQQAGRGKPDPYPLNCALEALSDSGHGVKPDEAVYIGDTGDDMIAARRAGMWAIGVIPPSSVPDRLVQERFLLDKGAHIVLPEVNDLPALLGPADGNRA